MSWLDPGKEGGLITSNVGSDSTRSLVGRQLQVEAIPA
jgi:hypothetical protein